MNNLLGRSSSDNRAVNFMPWETLNAKIEQGTIIGLLGDLAIVSSVNHLTETIEATNRAAIAARKIADYEAGNEVIANAKARSRANRPANVDPLNATVLDLKAQAQAEWLAEFSRE
jgi:hypothetical protein